VADKCVTSLVVELGGTRTGLSAQSGHKHWWVSFQLGEEVYVVDITFRQFNEMPIGLQGYVYEVEYLRCPVMIAPKSAVRDAVRAIGEIAVGEDTADRPWSRREWRSGYNVV